MEQKPHLKDLYLIKQSMLLDLVIQVAMHDIKSPQADEYVFM